MKLIETPDVPTHKRSNHPRKHAENKEAEISCSSTYRLYIQRVQRVRLSFLTIRDIPDYLDRFFLGLVIIVFLVVIIAELLPMLGF